MRRKLDFGVFGGAQQPGPGAAILAQIHAVQLVEPGGDLLRQQLVEIVAAELGVAVAGAHFDHAAHQLDQRYVEGAAAQIVHQHHLIFEPG